MYRYVIYIYKKAQASASTRSASVYGSSVSGTYDEVGIYKYTYIYLIDRYRYEYIDMLYIYTRKPRPQPLLALHLSMVLLYLGLTMRWGSISIHISIL